MIVSSKYLFCLCIYLINKVKQFDTQNIREQFKNSIKLDLNSHLREDIRVYWLLFFPKQKLKSLWTKSIFQVDIASTGHFFFSCLRQAILFKAIIIFTLFTKPLAKLDESISPLSDYRKCFYLLFTSIITFFSCCLHHFFFFCEDWTSILQIWYYYFF